MRHHNSIFPSIRISLRIKTNQSFRKDKKLVAHVCEIFLTRVIDMSHTCATSFG
jgi:hypothetical protein